MKKTKKTVLFLLFSLLFVSCVSDYDGLEPNSRTLWDNHSTRALGLKYSDFLTISALEHAEWTDSDFVAISKAKERIGVSFSKEQNRYIFKNSCASEINISDSLYQSVVGLYEYTNNLLNRDYSNNIIRIKTRTRDVTSPNYPSTPTDKLPDCVPAAIANMGKNAPRYEDIIVLCDSLYPNWIVNNGIPYGAIKPLIERYAPVTEYHDLSFCREGVHVVPNYVMVFEGHAVNAYKIIKGYLGNDIHYKDHSATSEGSGIIGESEMTSIYVFK